MPVIFAETERGIGRGSTRITGSRDERLIVSWDRPVEDHVRRITRAIDVEH